MSQIGYYLFRGTVFMFSLISMPLLYLLSDGLFFLFFYIFKYRKQVVLENLQRSFPEKSAKEIRLISKNFYKHFCDILLEGIKGLSMCKKELVKRYRITNPELINHYYEKNQSIITLAAHYANWEWGVLCSSLQVKPKTIGLYLPLSNKLIDQYIKKSRAAWGMYLLSVKDTHKGFEENKRIPSVYILVTDQSPSNKEKSIWINFLNQPTAFLHGAEKYAQQTSYSVLYTDIQRIKRGYYTVEFSVLSEHPKDSKPGEITALFANKLEKIIRAKPEHWLWSHRRWKHKLK
jgi:KDO2-lipid IV(A) lauroyltransferase